MAMSKTKSEPIEPISRFPYAHAHIGVIQIIGSIGSNPRSHGFPGSVR
jgi:hypothetical protein